MNPKADATPTKGFFVNMITRDISLEDCILDLIDNCIDGARRVRGRALEASTVIEDYDGFHVELRLSGDEFVIQDNCGGIGRYNAMHYAFHFGRPQDAGLDQNYAIGLYGIGMKRALLKLGGQIEIHSSTEDDAFLCHIDVPLWLDHDVWKFDMEDADLIPGTGTTIRVTDLHGAVRPEFEDDALATRLERMVSRDYTRFLDRGLQVTINGVQVTGHRYEVRADADFRPYRKQYAESDVRVDIIAGMAAPPPNDIGPSDRPDPAYYGWFVLCNDRVVLAADKSDRTVWGHAGFQQWHAQYNGFMGLVLFHSADPELLPWTTTKRDIDVTSAVYRRAISRMKDATMPWIDYTRDRRDDLDTAHAREETAGSVGVFEVEANPTMVLPKPQKPRVQLAHILYQRPVSEVRQVAEALGRKNMSYRAVGEKTFEHYLFNEVDE